jgi:hypothetical protein
MASRDRGGVAAFAVIAGRAGDEAIHSFFALRDGLLRCARNDDLEITLLLGCLKIGSVARNKPGVVPANAGTHNHRCYLLRERRPTASFTTSSTAYGSRRSPGRRGESRAQRRNHALAATASFAVPPSASRPPPPPPRFPRATAKSPPPARDD